MDLLPLSERSEAWLSAAPARVTSSATVTLRPPPAVLQASWLALVDAVEYKLAKDDLRSAKAKAEHAARDFVVSAAISASKQACAKKANRL